MDDDQFFESILATENNFHFKPLKTIPYSTVHAVVSFLISVIGTILAFFWKSENNKHCEEYFMILYIRCIYWVVTFLYDHLIKYHHEKLRMNGYHEFYRATSLHKGIPLHVVSGWNTVILGVQTIMQSAYGKNFFEHCHYEFSPTVYIVLFNALETIILIGVHGWYIKRVYIFNRSQLPPDAYRGLSESLSSVGVATRDAANSDLLEKQADLINYLKDHNNKLNQKLMTLNAQLRASSGSGPQN